MELKHFIIIAVLGLLAIYLRYKVFLPSKTVSLKVNNDEFPNVAIKIAYEPSMRNVVNDCAGEVNVDLNALGVTYVAKASAEEKPIHITVTEDGFIVRIPEDEE